MSAVSIMKIVVSGALPVLLSILFAKLRHKEWFAGLSYMKRQSLIGTAFGLSSCAASLLGIEITGLIMNLRDASPLCAALIFGSPSGILAGIIGAAFRAMYTLFTGIGAFSCLPCTIACLVAGIVGALCREYLFDNRPPVWINGMIVAGLTELIHVSLLLVTHLDNLRQAFSFVDKCALAIICGTAVSVGLALAAVRKTGRVSEPAVRDITQSFKIWLIICAGTGFTISSVITYAILTQVYTNSLDQQFRQGILRMEAMIDLAHEKGMGPDDLPENIHIADTGNLFVLNPDDEFLIDDNGRIGEKFTSVDFSRYPAMTLQRVIAGEKRWYIMYTHYEGYTIAAAITVSNAMFSRNAITYLLIMLELVIFTIMFMFIYGMLRKAVVRNLQTVNESLSEISSGNLDVKVDLRQNEEFSSISDDINMTVRNLRHYAKSVQELEESNRTLANHLQQYTAPVIFPPFPEQTEFDIYAKTIQSGDGKGSFYNFFMLPDHKVCIMVGDVSGSGLPGVVQMVRTKNYLYDALWSKESLSRVFAELNDLLQRDNPEALQISLWLGIIDLATGWLESVNAGEHAPFMFKDLKTITYQEKTGPALGKKDYKPVSVHKLQLHAGDRMCLMSNGLWSTKNLQNELISEEALHQQTHPHRYGTCQEVADAVIRYAEEFRQESPQQDDVSILEFQLMCLQTDSSIIIFPNKAGVDLVRQFAALRLRKLNASQRQQELVDMSIDEVLGTIVNLGKATEVKVEILSEGDDILVIMTDNGEKFILSASRRLEDAIADARTQFGSLGLFVLSRSAKMNYQSTEQGNQTSIRISSSS